MIAELYGITFGNIWSGILEQIMSNWIATNVTRTFSYFPSNPNSNNKLGNCIIMSPTIYQVQALETLGCCFWSSVSPSGTHVFQSLYICIMWNSFDNAFPKRYQHKFVLS